MPEVTRHAGAPIALALLLLLFAVGGAAAEEPLPAGPRLAVVLDKPTDERFPDIVTMDPSGKMRQRLVLGAGRNRPSWSADGSLLALGAYGKWEGAVAAVAEADGPGLRPYRNVPLGGYAPVISPDGRLVAFPRLKLVKVLPGRENYLYKGSIWLLSVKTGSVRRLTRWRLQTTLEPSSFSPDGSKIATMVFDRRGLRAVAVDLRSGKFSLLAREAMEPTYSPDGKRFAFVRYLNWRLNGIDETVPAMDELRIGRVGRVAGAHRLLRRRGFFTSPSWDPSGSRLAFIHSRADELGDRSPKEGDRVMAINTDGSCLTRVFSDPESIVSSVAWQPGPGREAGPIVC